MQVNFSFQQVLPTAYPGFEITLDFSGVAIVTCENVRIMNVFADTEMGGWDFDIPNAYEAQNLATGQMGKFLGMCREAARNAAYKIQKAEKPPVMPPTKSKNPRSREADAEAKFEASRPNNGGFVPSASDTSYMNRED